MTRVYMFPERDAGAEGTVVGIYNLEDGRPGPEAQAHGPDVQVAMLKAKALARENGWEVLEPGEVSEHVLDLAQDYLEVALAIVTDDVQADPVTIVQRDVRLNKMEMILGEEAAERIFALAQELARFTGMASGAPYRG